MDLKNPKVIWFKGALFLLLGILAAGILLLETRSWRIGLLLALCVWAFCRAYYFAFYVIEHYIDDEYKFAGLGSFVRYLWTRKRAPRVKPVVAETEKGHT